MLKKTLLIIAIIISGTFIFLETYVPPRSENYGRVYTRLYTGEADNQPLVVGFGGSEGGSPWDSDYWAETRNRFISEGYAFLSVGYFGMEGTPEALDRISLNAVYDSILQAARHPKINRNKIAVIGGSKGGELVLNLASRYDNISAVVAIVPSHVSFCANTIMANTASWTFNNEEVPFMPVPYAAVPAMSKGDLHGAFSVILENKEAEKEAAIEVEKINGPVLLLSAESDEFWPSALMSEKVAERLRENNFPYYFNHISFRGGHTEPLKHFDEVFLFLEQHFKNAEKPLSLQP